MKYRIKREKGKDYEWYEAQETTAFWPLTIFPEGAGVWTHVNDSPDVYIKNMKIGSLERAESNIRYAMKLRKELEDHKRQRKVEYRYFT